MRVSRKVGARARLAALLIPVLWVSAFGQAAPSAAQQSSQQPPSKPGRPAEPVKPVQRPTQKPPVTPPPTAQPPVTPPPAGQPPVVPPPPPTIGQEPVKTEGPQPAVQAPPSEAPPIQEQRTSGPTLQLSMDDAVKRGLEFNLDVQVTRINPRLQDLNVQLAQSVWVPSLTNQTQYTDQTSRPGDTLLGAADISDKTFLTTAGVQQFLPWFGTQYSVGWQNTRFETTARAQTFNPSFASSLTFSATQPLLRDFLIDGDRTQLLVTRKQREISDVQLHQQIVNTTRQIRNGYWDLVYARQNLSVAQQSLDLARQTLRDNRTRVEVGTMAPIDIVQAEAEVARNEETTIVAAAQIDEAEDALRRLIFDPGSQEYWTTNIDLSDIPRLPESTADVDVEAAVANALQRRTDLIQQRKSLEANDINIRYYRNQLLPQLDFFTTYGLSARGGTLLPTEAGQAPSQFSWGDVYSSLFGRDFPRWTVGVNVQYPLGRSNQEVTLARARLSYQQSQLGLRDQELSAANEVRTVGRTVNTNRRRVDATRSARIFSERQLEAQQKKFAVGLSTNFEVFQAQRDLAQARNSELQAVIDYVKSLVNFEAVQEAGVSNVSGTGNGSTGTGNTNGTGNTGNTGNTGTGGTNQGTGGQNR